MEKDQNPGLSSQNHPDTAELENKKNQLWLVLIIMLVAGCLATALLMLFLWLVLRNISF